MSKRYEEVILKIENVKASRAGVSPMYPSLLTMAKNLAVSLVDTVKEYARSGDLLVEEDEFLDRLEICCSCDLFDPDEIRCTHESCGCFLKAKGRLVAMMCPLYLWPGDIEKSILGLEAGNGEEETDQEEGN